ncbi:MAG: magnesium-translocating P-type ATPase [Armatimonadia bacterium]
MTGSQPLEAFWSVPDADVLEAVSATPQGLSPAEARRRLTQFGPNSLKAEKSATAVGLFLKQFTSPLVLLLLIAAILSAFLGDVTDMAIILLIVLTSGVLSFFQERGAVNAVAKLLAIVEVTVAVTRDGKAEDIPLEEIVRGDVVELNAGDVIPGDCRLLSSKDLYVDEAALTGETYPEEKQVGTLPADTALGQRTNTLYMGTHVVSGNAQALVVATGMATEFGKVSQRLTHRRPETEFEQGVRRFGSLLMELTLVMVLAIFAINVFLKHDVKVLDSFMFALAIAVGLTPQLLPAIITINLAHGARQMAEQKVIVKRLVSIEDFGSMTVLCSDKTGTLTEGKVTLRSALDVNGQDSERVLTYAYLNSVYETGFSNPIDEAIRSFRDLDSSAYEKLDEVPYDFLRKRLSILVCHEGPTGADAQRVLITKGALQNVLEVCTDAETAPGTVGSLASVQRQVDDHFAQLSSEGCRVLGLAYRNLDADVVTKADETRMTFLGLLVFFDPPKADVGRTIVELAQLGISLKIITGDNPLVATSVSRQVGMADPVVLSGAQLRMMGDAALWGRVGQVDVFAEIEPNQKERIILALRKAGHIVGYIGDGINDASALHAADVGLSVESGVDVAKNAADIVLLEHSLEVLVHGVRAGRATFANTLKYVFMATSANFGNMFSMAGASLFLRFLPLLPKQILLTNLLTDFPEMTIATDGVDPELVDKPRRWNLRFIRDFMIVFGLLSSVFDYMTFGVLILLLHASPEQFRSGWFLESVASAALVVLVIRTRRTVFRSMPSKPLLFATLACVAAAALLPLTPLGPLLGFAVLPIGWTGLMLAIVALYVAAAEIAKARFYQRTHL